MSVAGNVNEVLKQIQLLIKIYGNVSIRDIEKSIQSIRQLPESQETIRSIA